MMKKVKIKFMKDLMEIETVIISETEDYFITKDGEFKKDDISSVEWLEDGNNE